jgi:hypothetical protein
MMSAGSYPPYRHGSITSTYHSPALLGVLGWRRSPSHQPKPLLHLNHTIMLILRTSRMSDDDVYVYTSGSPARLLTPHHEYILFSNYAPTLLRHRPLVSSPSTSYCCSRYYRAYAPEPLCIAV